MAGTTLPSSNSELVELQPNAPEVKASPGLFVVVDVAKLSQLFVADAANDSNSAMVKNPLSRKVPQGGGAGPGERDKKKTAEGDHPAVGGPEKPSLPVLSASEAPDHGARWRRFGTRRTPSAWLDPGRVVVLFAALSSMGTLILLYFTLSISKTTLV